MKRVLLAAFLQLFSACDPPSTRTRDQRIYDRGVDKRAILEDTYGGFTVHTCQLFCLGMGATMWEFDARWNGCNCIGMIDAGVPTTSDAGNCR